MCRASVKPGAAALLPLVLFALLVFLTPARADWTNWHPLAWSSARGAVETVSVYATSHRLVVTNWYGPLAIPATNSFLANIQTWSNAAPFSNNWRVTVFSNGTERVITNTTVAAHQATNLVLSGREIVAFDCFRAIAERAQALGAAATEPPRLYRAEREALVWTKAWIAENAQHFVDYRQAVGTNGFNAALATNRWRWLNPDSTWRQEPATVKQWGGISPYIFAGEGVASLTQWTTFPHFSSNSILEACALPYDLSVATNQTGVSVYGWQVGNTNVYSLTVTNTPGVTITNLVRNWYGFTPWRDLIGLATNSAFSNSTAFVLKLPVNRYTASDYAQRSNTLSGCQFFYPTTAFTCWSQQFLSSCDGLETNFWRFLMWRFTNATPEHYSVEIYKLSEADRDTNDWVNQGFFPNTPVYSNQFTNATTLVWTGACECAVLASNRTPRDYGWSGASNALSMMRWTESTGEWVGVTHYQQAVSLVSTSMNDYATNGYVAASDVAAPVASYIVTNAYSFAERGPNPQSVFFWALEFGSQLQSHIGSGVFSNWFEGSSASSVMGDSPVWAGPTAYSFENNYNTATMRVVSASTSLACQVDAYLAAFNTSATGTIQLAVLDLQFVTNVCLLGVPSVGGGNFNSQTLSGDAFSDPDTTPLTAFYEDIFGWYRQDTFSIGSSNVTHTFTAATNFAHSAALQLAGSASKTSGTDRVEFIPSAWQASAPDITTEQEHSTLTVGPQTCTTGTGRRDDKHRSAAGAWATSTHAAHQLIRWDVPGGFNYGR